MGKAKFNLRWSSNSRNLQRLVEEEKTGDPNTTAVGILGLHWNTTNPTYQERCITNLLTHLAGQRRLPLKQKSCFNTSGKVNYHGMNLFLMTLVKGGQASLLT